MPPRTNCPSAIVCKLENATEANMLIKLRAVARMLSGLIRILMSTQSEKCAILVSSSKDRRHKSTTSSGIPGGAWTGNDRRDLYDSTNWVRNLSTLVIDS